MLNGDEVIVTGTSSSSKSKRIFIGTTEIAGYYRNLGKGLDALGVNYKYVQLSPNTSGFGSESKLPFLIRLPYLLAKHRLKISIEPGLYTVHKSKSGILSLAKYFLYMMEWLLRVFVVLPWAVTNFDVFCFGVRSNIIGIKTGYWDIALLKLLGKRIIYVYHGSDGRPPYINGSILHNLLNKYPNWEEKLIRLIKMTKNAVVKVDNFADVIVENPYSAHFHEKKFVNWFSIGSPYCSPQATEDEDKTADGKIPLRILHAPTHRVAKGSAIIEECIRRLQQQGYQLELVLIHGRPHEEVIAEIKKCDFVIDELYSDALMAGFAAEASFYAKPVIACGYVEDVDIKEAIPTHYCKPEELESAVLKFINDATYRMALGQRAQAFVKNEWSYLRIAERFVKIFNDEIPENWFVDPQQITYLHGFGMPENLLKKCIASLIQKEGLSVLQLNDKPRLQNAFLNFSGLK